MIGSNDLIRVAPMTSIINDTQLLYMFCRSYGAVIYTTIN